MGPIKLYGSLRGEKREVNLPRRKPWCRLNWCTVVCVRVVVPTDAFVLGLRVHGEPVDARQVLGGELVGRPQLDLRLHVGQVDPGGERARAVVALLGLLDEGVWRVGDKSDVIRARLGFSMVPSNMQNNVLSTGDFFCRPIILAVLVEITFNFHRMHRNKLGFQGSHDMPWWSFCTVE